MAPSSTAAALKNTRLVEQPLESRHWTWWRVERRRERRPRSGVEAEMAAVGESLLGTCQGAFENELADGAMGRRGSCLQPAFGVRRQSQVELLGAGGLHVRSPLRNQHSRPARHCHDNPDGGRLIGPTRRITLAA